MIRASLARQVTISLCAVALAAALNPSAIAQTPRAADQDVTTVSPLIITAPQVGEGATYFTPEALAEAAHTSRQEGIDMRSAAQQCHGASVNDSMRPPHTEDRGDFDLEALYDTEGKAQLAVWRASEKAETATKGALDARAAAARGAGTEAAAVTAELARQAAVKAFQDAQAAVTEAHRRVADLQELAAEHVGGDVILMQTLQMGKYVAGCTFIGPGQLAPGTRCDAPPEDMRQFASRVQERTAERAANGGQQTLFVPDEFRDLHLSEIQAHERQEAGVTVLRITGKITNPRKSAIAVPPLWVSALDRYGTSLASQQIEAPRRQGRIPAGGSLVFTYAVKPYPDKTSRASVTFAPFHRVPANLGPSAFCPA